MFIKRLTKFRNIRVFKWNILRNNFSSVGGSFNDTSATGLENYIDRAINRFKNSAPFTMNKEKIRKSMYSKFIKRKDEQFEFYRTKITPHGFRHQFQIERYNQEKAPICEILRQELLNISLLVNIRNNGGPPKPRKQKDKNKGNVRGIENRKPLSDDFKNSQSNSNATNTTNSALIPSSMTNPVNKVDKKDKESNDSSGTEK